SKKDAGDVITVLTAYDYATAQAVDRAGVDAILVGDSLGMVVLGYENTLPVTRADMLHHCKAVARGARRCLLIGDMPFMSYQTSTEDAVRNAGRFLQEAGMDSVKLEGARHVARTVEAIVAGGIPVMGHIGLTPQSFPSLGGWKVQGRTAEAAARIVEDAHLLQEAGCFAVVLESIPSRLAELVTSRLRIPTIGIGAGAACDGQVLVIHDLLGLFDRFTPKFVRKYADLHAEMVRACASYRADVEARRFPAPEHTFQIADQEWDELMKRIDGPRSRS
ncbi:MAG: 3-methyl-2-oxobutanoate hydroxymethyltransferase, partial [Acidobacteriota bacterium]